MRMTTIIALGLVAAALGWLAGGEALAQAAEPGGAVGRYLRIELAGNWLSLAEVDTSVHGERLQP